MNCERCGKDTTVSKYEVDEFSGSLCEECVQAWDEISNES